MTDYFPAAVAYLLGDEKGFVDDPADAGGPTKYGITQATLSRWRRAHVSREMVEALEPAEAMQIYREWFWKPLSCEKLTGLTTATIILNAGVLFGVGIAAAAAQKAARKAGHSTLAVDGHLGPTTVAALNSTDPRQFAVSFACVLRERAEAICRKTPRDKRFLAGWLSRVDSYAKINV